MKAKYILYTILILLIAVSITAWVYEKNNRIQSQQDRANSKLAIQTKNAEYCEAIKKESIRINCYSSLISYQQNPEYCQNIPEGDGRYYCLAVVLKDPEYCKKIQYFTTRGTCFGTIAVDLNNVEVCESADTRTRNGCYTRMASAFENPEFCEKTTGYSKENCFSLLIHHITEAEHCAQIKLEADTRNKCYALVLKDIEYCRDIKSEGKRGNCFGMLSENDPDVCEVDEAEIRDTCYATLAHQTDNIDYCKKVEDYGRQQNCFQAFD